MSDEEHEPFTYQPITLKQWLTIVAIVLILVIWLLGPNLLPQTSNHGPDPCKKNLKAIGLAIHYYHEEYGSFPPAFLTDANGNPTLSWRVLILPFMDSDEKKLYEQFDLNKPWHAPENWPLLAEMPSCYRCPVQEKAHPDLDWATHYLAVTGPHTAFPDSGTTNIDDFTDGSTNSYMIVEDPVQPSPWTAPFDVTIEQFLDHADSAPSEMLHEHGHYALFADGSTKFITRKTDKDTLRRLMTIDDGEEIGSY